MRKIYITFSGAAYDATTQRIVEDAPRLGADEVRVYDDAWLRRTPFYTLNRWIFDRAPQMGYGWCSWKPWLILETLKSMHDGDVLLYSDADAYPIADLSQLFDHAALVGHLLFQEQGCINRHWTRRACWRAMGLDQFYDGESQHACGRYQFFRKGGPSQYFNERLLQEWLTYSLNPECQFHGNPDNEPELIRHSAEQSVLSLLAYKWKILLHRTPDQNGWPNTVHLDMWYPQVFNHAGTNQGQSDRGSRYRNV